MFSKRGYLLDVSGRTPKRSTFEELVDTLVAYRYNEFWLFAEKAIPDDVDAERLAAYCRMQGIDVRLLNRDAYAEAVADRVVVRTEAARSLAGRVEEMRERMIEAETKGRAIGAKGFLVVDFADDCNWQPLCVSLPAILMGGAFASSGAKSAKMDLERELDRVLGAPLGGVLLKLGTLYLRGGAMRPDGSELFNILASPIGYSRHPGLTDCILDEISGIACGIRIACEKWTDRRDWAKEIAYAAQLVDAACNRRDERRLRELRDEHGRIWRMRFADFGRVESLSRLPRF